MDISIGTGKGYWDWTPLGSNLQREVSISPGGGLLLDFQITEMLTMETGFAYQSNRCVLSVDDKKYIFLQPILEIPLSAKLYFSPTTRVFAKGGVALAILLDQAKFENENSGDSLLQDSQAENYIQCEVLLGLGYEHPLKNRRLAWLTEFQYSTFYTSPDYKRVDGSKGNIRFHRFQLSAGVLF